MSDFHGSRTQQLLGEPAYNAQAHLALIQTLYAAHPFKDDDAVTTATLKLVGSVLKAFKHIPQEAVCEALCVFTHDLLNENNIYYPPEPPTELPQQRSLLEEYERVYDPQRREAALQAVRDFITTFVNALPTSAWEAEAQGISIPLSETLKEGPAIMQLAVCKTAFSQDSAGDFLFPRTQEHARININIASGNAPDDLDPRKIIAPLENPSPRTRLAALYLAETPFLALFNCLLPFEIPNSMRAEHTHILGPSGSGKTTLLQQLILQDLAQDNPPGMVIIDPKGLMVERIQSLDVFNPTTGRLKDRLVVIDPTHNPPPALNMFHAASAWNRMWSEDQRRRIENQVISTFAFIFSSSGSKLTDKQSVPFSYAVRLMFGMESTIHTLVDLMDDPTRTDDAKGQKYSECKFAPFIGRLDPVSQRFFEKDFFSANYKETRQQIKARIYGVLQHPEFVRMFEARERKLDLLDCLQNRSIVLVNTGMNTMGGDASQLLGRYIIALTLNAAFARFTLPKNQWHQAHLYIDEFQEFADDDKTPELLRLAREYKLAVTLAHQEMHGAGVTDKIRSAISTNTTVKYSSRPEGADINYVARDMRCDPDFLTKMTKTATEARFACFVRGMTEHPFAVSVPFGNIQREPQMSAEAHEALLTANAARLSSKEPAKRIVQSQPVTAAPASDAPESGSTW